MTMDSGQFRWVPEEIVVRVVESDQPVSLSNRLPGPEAGEYAPSFSLWDGAPVLDLLFQAGDLPKLKGRVAPVLFLNLFVPSDDSSPYLH